MTEQAHEPGLKRMKRRSLVLVYYLCSPDFSEGRAAVIAAERRGQTSDHGRAKTQYFRPLVRTACEYFHLRSVHRMHERKEGGERTTLVGRGTGDRLVD